MARHAGFAAAITIAEAYLNQQLWIEFQKLDPISTRQLFAIPGIVPLVGGRSARLSGIALFDPRPTLSLAPNPTNSLAVTTAAIVFVNGALISGAAVIEERTWKVRVEAEARVGVDIEVAGDGVYARWQPAGSAIDALTVTSLDGAAIPDWLVQALNSAAMRNALNQALQALGPVRISGKLFPSVISHVQSVNIPSTGLSRFDWFTIDEPISGAAVRVLDGVLSIGVNLANFPAGNPAALVDLNQQIGDSVAYSWPASSNTLRPLLVPAVAQGGDIAALVNADVVHGIVDKISAQIAGSPIHPDVKLKRISLSPAHFMKPLRGREIALKLDIAVTHDLAGDVEAHAFLQFFFRNSWAIYVGHVEVDVPWWVDVAVVVIGVGLAALLPALSPLIAVAAVAAIDGIIPGAIGNGTAQAAAALDTGQGIAGGVYANTITIPAGDVTAYQGTKGLYLGSDGLGMSTIDVVPSVRFATQSDLVDVASLEARLDAGSITRYLFRLALRPDLAALAPDCTAQIIVTRADTGQEVGRSEGPFSISRTLLVDHLTEALYFVDSFHVSARIFLNRIGLEGLLFAVETDLAVSDTYNRHKPFVTWSKHTAYFRSPDDPAKYWSRNAHPSIHRTAASSRCLALRQRVERSKRLSVGLGAIYLDDLGFDFVQVPERRKDLCDYCFFGGPDQNEPFPSHDWFRR